MKKRTLLTSPTITGLSVFALLAALFFIGHERKPTHQELMRAHAFKARNDFTADNARTQRAINALLMGAE